MSRFGGGRVFGGGFRGRVARSPVIRDAATEMAYDLLAEQMDIPTQTGQPTIGGTLYQAAKGLVVAPMMSDTTKSYVLPRTHAQERKQKYRYDPNRYQQFQKAASGSDRKAGRKMMPGDAPIMTHLMNDHVLIGAIQARETTGGSEAIDSYIDGKLGLLNIQNPATE